MQELPLWGQALARDKDPKTSHESARKVRGSVASKLEGAWIKALKANGPMTSEEVSIFTGIDLQSMSPRPAQMERKGILRRTNLRRPGASGHSRIVWELV